VLLLRNKDQEHNYCTSKFRNLPLLAKEWTAQLH